MKLRFTNVTTQDVNGQLKGISASYEATDSDGFGNVGIDSGGLSPSDSYQPSYSSIAQVEALTQTQIYNDFYPTEVIDSESVGEMWLAGLEENLELQIAIDKESKTPTIEIADNITDQTPINL